MGFEIIKEIKLALQEVGRKLSKYTAKKRRVKDELKKRSFIEKYIPHVAEALKDILELTPAVQGELEEQLQDLLEKERGAIKKLDFDPEANEEYDEELANFSKAEAEHDTNEELDDEGDDK